MTGAAQDPATMFAPPAVEVVRRSDGASLLRSGHPLQNHARCMGEYLERWAREAFGRPFLMERATGGEFRGLTYGETLEEVYRVAAWLLEQDLSAERPVAILSENGVEHAVLMLACLHVGIPVAPISPAYSLVSKDFVRLRNIFKALRPGLVYAADATRFAPALAAVRDFHRGPVVVATRSSAVDSAVELGSLRSSQNTSAVERAFARVSPDTIAKFMLTSGSTDEPKVVINTQRMLCSNQQAILQLWPFIGHAPVLVDWLPWHHTFGGNHNFNLILRNGGTLYVDEGRPVPGPQFDRSLANLREIAPTVFFNVPRAYDLLVAALRNDPALRVNFFSRLKLLFYAAAGLPQHVWEALEDLATETLGRRLPIVSSWGLTETAPAATSCHYQAERSGVVGLPIPGCELKLVPTGAKLEARVRGPNVTPGYWKQPELTARFFDEDGFFKTGDAMRWVDPERPERGLVFDGRLGEDFKLSTGTWVSVSALRLKAIAALAPVAEDVVVAGHDRDEIGLLIFPNVDACRRLCPDAPRDAPAPTVVLSASVRACVAAGLAALERTGGGSSTYATRAIVMAEPPCVDDGEITDKGYINQRAVLSRRSSLVDTLYRTPFDPCVVRPAEANGVQPSSFQ
jgi:feruloyl-CoA synthase